jgi:hypothetical protein
MEHSPVCPVYYNMRNITNIPLRKLIKNKRFSSTVKNSGGKTTTYNYRITNIKMGYGDDDPTLSEEYRSNLKIVNIVCSSYTTTTNASKVVNENAKPLIRGNNPKQPRREIIHALLDSWTNNERTSNDLRNFLKHIGITGNINIGTIKLVPTPGM